MLVIFPCLTLDDWITGSSVNLSHEQFRRETPPIGCANGVFPLRARGFPFLNSLKEVINQASHLRIFFLLSV